MRATWRRAPLLRPCESAELPAVGRAPAAGLTPVQALPAQQHARRLQHDAGVEAQRPVLDLPQVELDPLVPGKGGPAAHLRPARDAGLHREAAELAGRVLLDLRANGGTRADQAQ